MRLPRRPGPLLLAVVLHVALCTASLAALTALCQGRLVYVLDDAYIHMAMAKNLAEHGMWGVTRHEFSSSSSSPLWTMMLAGAFRMGGARPGWPLALNLLAGLLVLAVAAEAVRRLAPRESSVWTLGILAALVLFAPLPALTFTGQEHLLHASLALAFAVGAAFLIEQPPASEDEQPLAERLGLPLLAAAMVATRYEGLFLVATAAVLLLARGRRGAAIALSVAALVPVAVYAQASTSQGWFALPNPVLLKGNLADIARVRHMVASVVGGHSFPEGVFSGLSDLAHLAGLTALTKLVHAPHLLTLVIAALALSGRRVRLPAADPGRALLMLFVGSTLLHLQFARTGWFHRYEAYLVAMGIVAVGIRLATTPVSFDSSENLELWGAAADIARRKTRMRRRLLAAIMLVPLVERGLVAQAQLPRAAANVHEQQFQMGLFFAEHYSGQAVAVNDVGAVNWVADLHCLDMEGLSTLEVARRRMDLAWHRDAIDEVTARAGIRVAAVYDKWYDQASTGGLPPGWTRVANWTIVRNIVAADATVTFYAVHPAERTKLLRTLKAFQRRLPTTVAVSYFVTPRREIEDEE